MDLSLQGPSSMKRMEIFGNGNSDDNSKLFESELSGDILFLCKHFPSPIQIHVAAGKNNAYFFISEFTFVF